MVMEAVEPTELGLQVVQFKSSCVFGFSSCRTRHRGGSQNNSRLWKKNKYLASCSFKEKYLI